MSIGDVRQMLGDREMLNKLTNMRLRALGQHNSEIPQKIAHELVVADVLRSLDTRFENYAIFQQSVKNISRLFLHVLKINSEKPSSLTDIFGDILKNVGKYMHFLKRTTLAASDTFTIINLLRILFSGNHRQTRIRSIFRQCKESYSKVEQA